MNIRTTPTHGLTSRRGESSHASEDATPRNVCRPTTAWASQTVRSRHRRLAMSSGPVVPYPDGRSSTGQLGCNTATVSFALDPATVIEDGDVWVLAVNRNQNLLGKTMLVLRRPCSTVVGLDQAESSSLQVEIVRITSGLRSLFEPDQFNYAFLMNVDAQVHLHVIPRYASPRTWRGREFTDANWGRPFGTDQLPLPSDDLAALAADVRTALGESV